MDRGDGTSASRATRVARSICVGAAVAFGSIRSLVLVLQEAERAGGSIVRPAALAEWGGTSGAFADPDGYVWEVADNAGWTITDDGSIRI